MPLTKSLKSALPNMWTITTIRELEQNWLERPRFNTEIFPTNSVLKINSNIWGSLQTSPFFSIDDLEKIKDQMVLSFITRCTGTSITPDWASLLVVLLIKFSKLSQAFFARISVFCTIVVIFGEETSEK